MKFSQPLNARLLYSFVLVLGLCWIWYSAVPANMVTNGEIPAPQKGFLAPDFILKTLNGQSVQLSALKGQVVLVNLWASWCPPCKAEMPAIDHVYQAYKKKGFMVLGVDSTVQDTVANVNSFVSDNKLSFPILLDQNGLATRLYNIQSLPTSFFVGPDGIIRDVIIGGPMSEAFLQSSVEKYLSEAH